MHRIILPVDFSETSLNAARYTAGMLAGKENTVVTIYHNYETNNDADISMIYQESLKKEFDIAGVKEIECEHDMGGDLIENISRLSKATGATLVIMGITGKSAIRQVMFGSNTLKLIDRNFCPVMIIPPDATYKGIANMAFASDFKNVEVSTPAALINAVLGIFNSKLHVINIGKENVTQLPPELNEGKIKLKEMFQQFNPEFHFLIKNNFYDALDNFIKEKNIDVLITVPKHQSNSSSLFKSTHTKKLAYHSHIPILAAHL